MTPLLNMQRIPKVAQAIQNRLNLVKAFQKEELHMRMNINPLTEDELRNFNRRIVGRSIKLDVAELED